ncbi:PQ loop repeat protein [Patellaria atrata CBS 101060]|uniref:PQ loop repeat protein n=1 Tax=Patellaria atrata CBS 101060 TaxID=1346257 RepID=A0A9P4SBB0_9PEZI|nr:PQ loop repeat protein [Patellaria atrata CBS 101060]
MDVPVAANTLGILGAICWSVQLLPQIIINYRRHNTVGLQPSMMMLWACAGVPLGVYNIVEDFNIALRVQPQILTLLSLVTWIQCYYYEKKWSIARSLTVVIPVMCIMGGIQASLIIALRIASSTHIEWPKIVMAVLSAALLAAGVLRHYWDIYIHRTVRGISFIFVAIDAAGDLTSLVSVFFQPKLDVLGMVIYGSELVLWLGVFAAGGYYNLSPWVRRRIEQKRSVNDIRGLGDQRIGTNDNDVHENITIHSLPSSTSVFRTPSGELAARRARRTFYSRSEELVHVSGEQDLIGHRTRSIHTIS